MRRRKTRYQWLLPTGTIGPAADTDDFSNGRDFGALAVPANGTTIVKIVDLLVDVPSEEVAPAVVITMASTTQNGYFLKRIVGKLFCSLQDNNSNGVAVLVGAGIFVARAGDSTDFAGAENLPIGSASNATQVDNYSPLSPENIREPWIWRRTWILGQAAAQTGGGPPKYPGTVAGYGSIQDGPHIDAKTARRVRDGERLFAILAARNYPVNTAIAGPATGNTIEGYIDYRCLGAPRRDHNRSAF